MSEATYNAVLLIGATVGLTLGLVVCGVIVYLAWLGLWRSRGE